mmetsp:Transcript_26155/g.29912  ORF Transcript_26155/g.29912 Transcript_26155/m.29912 type:complete len:181 (-) Transcript_26155:168-710(-)
MKLFVKTFLLAFFLGKIGAEDLFEGPTSVECTDGTCYKECNGQLETASFSNAGVMIMGSEVCPTICFSGLNGLFVVEEGCVLKCNSGCLVSDTGDSDSPPETVPTNPPVAVPSDAPVVAPSYLPTKTPTNPPKAPVNLPKAPVNPPKDPVVATKTTSGAGVKVALLASTTLATIAGFLAI